MIDFLSRVYDAKNKFVCNTGDYPTHLFFGPKEYMQLREYTADLERRGLIKRDGDTERAIREYKDTLAGMTIIGLMSDGMYAGKICT